MALLEKLDKFNLEDHGDRHERRRWPLVRDRFANYQVFWRLYVVPLTNRACGPATELERASWTRLRGDVPEEWEKLAVCHYSVFFHLSRAAERRIEQASVKPGEPTHPEDVIYLLQTCCENVKDFYDAVRAISVDGVNYLRRQLLNDPPFVFSKIAAYRNLLIHNPVLGRGEKHGETLLPKLPEDPKCFNDWNNRFKFSWRAVEAIGAEDLDPAVGLLQILEDDLARYLDGAWAQLIVDLGSRNLHDKFNWLLKLPDSSEWITVVQPVAASGVFLK